MANVANRYFVVGDTFAGTAKNLPDTLTETEALDIIHNATRFDHDIYFYAQQGVDLRSLSAAVKSHNEGFADAAGQIHLVSASSAPRATRRLAHKNRAENIVISAPRRLSETGFEMDLFFSSQNEFFLDHMTGMHIQGIVLIEAARQAFLAVTEAFFLKGDPNDYYFVIKNMDASYQNFVFPFDAKLTYDITRASQKDNRHSFDAEIAIIQTGNVCTTVKVGFTAFESATINAKEKSVAAECHRKLLELYASLHPAPAPAPAIA